MSRWSTKGRFTVRQVTSSSWRDHLQHPVFGRALGSGTASTTVRYPESFNGLLAVVADFNKIYGSPAVRGVGFGPVDESGRCSAFRWAWERDTEWGRVTDTLFVSVDSWE